MGVSRLVAKNVSVSHICCDRPAELDAMGTVLMALHICYDRPAKPDAVGTVLMVHALPQKSKK